jgi:ribose transport system substrate-binding protein
MNNLEKAISWKTLVFVVIVAILVGCMAQQAPTVTQSVVPSAAQQDGVYYFLAANNSDPFYIPGVKGFTEAGKEVGMKTEFVGPMEASTSEQMKTFEQLCSDTAKTKGVFWYAMDFNVGEPIVKECINKGIPVVIGAADSPYKTRTAFIGYNNTVLGNQAAEWAAKLISCKGSVGTIAINGANLEERTTAFNAHMKEICPDVTVYDRASHDGSAASASNTIDAYMVAHPDLSLLWFADGGAGQQAQLWKDKQAQGIKTLFLAMDMPPATLQAVKDGVFVGSVGQDTYTEEFWGLKLLDAARNGQRVPDTVYLSAILVDKNNVDQFMEK